MSSECIDRLTALAQRAYGEGAYVSDDDLNEGTETAVRVLRPCDRLDGEVIVAEVTDHPRAAEMVEAALLVAVSGCRLPDSAAVAVWHERAEAAESRVKELETLIGDCHEVMATQKRQREEMEAQAREIVICAAIRLPDGRVFRGHRHSNCIDVARTTVNHRHRIGLEPEPFHGIYEKRGLGDQGFITSRNRFVGREEAYRLQVAAGIESVARDGYRGELLFSEDLY